MSIEVMMPQMGESVVEGTVTKWLVKEGDRVQEDQPLCEISTDKVDTEIPSPGTGVIAKLIAAEGETLPIGAPLALIEASGAQAAGAPAGVRTQPKAAPAPRPRRLARPLLLRARRLRRRARSRPRRRFAPCALSHGRKRPRLRVQRRLLRRRAAQTRRSQPPRRGARPRPPALVILQSPARACIGATRRS